MAGTWKQDEIGHDYTNSKGEGVGYVMKNETDGLFSAGRHASQQYIDTKGPMELKFDILGLEAAKAWVEAGRFAK